jgi:hypothetical protein
MRASTVAPAFLKIVQIEKGLFAWMQAFRVACHYGDTETEMDSSLRSTSVVVFNRLVIFVLKEADEIFRKLLGVTKDAELASGSVRKQPRYASQLYPCRILTPCRAYWCVS